MNHFHYVLKGKDKKGRDVVELRPNSLFSCAEFVAELRANDVASYARFMCEVELSILLKDFEWIGNHPYRLERVEQFRLKIGELRRIGGLSYRQVKKYYALK